jgi:hypothetical protein
MFLTCFWLKRFNGRRSTRGFRKTLLSTAAQKINKMRVLFFFFLHVHKRKKIFSKTPTTQQFKRRELLSKQSKNTKRTVTNGSTRLN